MEGGIAPRLPGIKADLIQGSPTKHRCARCLRKRCRLCDWTALQDICPCVRCMLVSRRAAKHGLCAGAHRRSETAQLRLASDWTPR